MLLASISMLSAAIGRIFIFAGVPFGPAALAGLFLSSDIFVAALVLYDLVARGRIHPASVWGGAGVVLFKPALLALAFTPPWLAFAEWLR
jgi:hypothetical protein